MEELGLIHLYCGDGKGKTTAAMGLALRAGGYGLRVGIIQFLKDGDSSELKALETFPSVRILSGKGVDGFTFQMTQEELEAVRQTHNQHLEQGIAWARKGAIDLLVLDEAVGTDRMGLLDHQLLLSFLREKPEGMEVVLTGRNPSEDLLELADYVSEVKKIKHPFDKGICARDGIEK